MQRATELVTMATYSRMRNLARSTITRQVKAGALATVGGLIDVAAADEARNLNLDQVRRGQAEKRKAQRSAAPAAAPAVAQPAGGRVSCKAVFEGLIRNSVRLPEILAQLGCHDPVVLMVAAEAFCEVVFALGAAEASGAYDWSREDRSVTPKVDVADIAKRHGFEFDEGTVRIAAARLAEKVVDALYL